ncbi:hypothetical protein BCR44DRAFT_1178300 [Catenaria anguillulae PL171]|uniref:Uncharacterized protein n=1 Tax=Catenaria anguillulae PL171 TaxID=765915 RepID=A0A1Y2HMA0_9FUNG|nr:hypothetical protein BCR44DRAFT_1178300 [Catenaria anguillulae PL171]
MLDVSRNDLGFLYAGQASAVYVTLPTCVSSRAGPGSMSCSAYCRGPCRPRPCSLLRRRCRSCHAKSTTCLSALVCVAQACAVHAAAAAAAATQCFRDAISKAGFIGWQVAAAPQLKNGATATASGVRISCDGVSLSMVTTRGVLQVHSDLITGSKLGDTWSFDSSQLSLAFLSLNRTMLSQVRFALSMSSSATLLRLGLSRFEMMVQPKAMLQLVDLVAFIAGETAVRKKAKEAELNQLSTTTQKVMESLDVNAAGGQVRGPSKVQGQVAASVVRPLSLESEMCTLPWIRCRAICSWMPTIRPS